MSDKDLHYDIIVVGAGPAGLTSAIYSAWLGLKTTIIESGIVGGRAWMASKIDNFPGFPDGIAGSELIGRMSKQAKQFGAEFKNDEVIALDLKAKLKKVISHTHTYTSSVVIIATGTQRRKLRVAGAAEFLGRGVSYCATCDGPFFRNKPVAVIGNGEEAVIEALYLADLSNKVTIVTEDPDLAITGPLMEKLRDRNNIEVVRGKVTQITGDVVVRAIKLQDFLTQNETELEARGIFIALGAVPLTVIVQKAGISIDKGGCLTVDRQQKTSVEGIFAAGDCTCGGMQVITAAGEGAMAAMKASIYIRKGTV